MNDLGRGLSFRDLAVQVLSLRVVLTAVFGMGTGVFQQLNHQGQLVGVTERFLVCLRKRWFFFPRRLLYTDGCIVNCFKKVLGAGFCIVVLGCVLFCLLFMILALCPNVV
jgi:hypothetical protein